MSAAPVPVCGAAPLWSRRTLLSVAAASCLALPACGRGPSLKLGLLATLAGRGAGLGEEGRNGALLAVESFVSRGERVSLLVEDDGQDPERAQQALRRLVAAPVDAVIGPFTSTVAEAVLPVAESAGLLLVSPTVTALEFHGRDDMLVRIHRTTRDNAQDYARMLQARGLRRAALAYDTGNRRFSLSWLTEFQRAYEAAGGAVVLSRPFEDSADAGTEALVQALLAAQPEVVVLVANAVDSARLGQRLRLSAPGLPLAAAEWAATETLVELAGQSLEGLLLLQPHDRDSQAPAYQAFLPAYRQRFGREPGFAAVAAHDAVTVVVTAAQRRTPGQGLKAAVLAHGPYAGLQQDIAFDAQGDTERRVLFTELHQGRFRALPEPRT